MHLKKLILLVYFLIALFFSCQKEKIHGDISQMKFSNDTIVFDTVFSTVGSTTRWIKIFNLSQQTLRIERIYLSHGTSSQFRINLNGLKGVYFENFEILPRDSVYLFAEVTVDPTNDKSPFIVEDSIIFETAEGIKKLFLVAFGKNAYFHYPTHPQTNYLPAYSLVSGTWKNDKPHVIYGYAVVDEDCTLVIPAGTKIYMHHNAVLWVYKGGTLKILGTPTQPVIIRGDRLDQYYRDLPGMWGKIWLSAGSINNEIHYADIRNGRIGIQVDTIGNSPNPTLTMSNTILTNFSTAAFVAQGSKVYAYNCVFGNAGYFSILLNIGGDYIFKHCTVGNFWTTSTRTTPAVLLNNYYKDINGNWQIRDLHQAYFGNCIIYGNLENEIGLDKFPSQGAFNYTFDHCLVKTKLTPAGYNFNQCLFNQDPLFYRTDSTKLWLKDLSPAIDKGDPLITGPIGSDILNNPRWVGSFPDLGAYEKTP
ncbi:MAG: hypothetical protein N2Z72_07790 [Bacteroidales bacterium]|nr:hypothetical protein [Bacteroidales bacterium]